MKSEAPTALTSTALTSTALTPGQQLSAARREKGISLAQISQATRIIESRLEAIERDDYSAVGTSQAIVIGYVKAFAKQIGIPSGGMVKVLETYFQQRKITEINDSAAPLTPKVTHFGPWLASALAVFVFLGLGQWYISQQAESPFDFTQTEPNQLSGVKEALTVEEHNKQDSPRQESSNPPEVSSLSTTAIQSELKLEPATEQTLPPINVSIIENTVESTVESTVQNAIKSSNESSYGASTANTPADEVDLLLNDSNLLEDTLANSGTKIDAQQGRDSLVLAFSGECWLEIFDAKGKRLVVRLAKEDDVIELTGQAPFDLKLGDATVVAVTVNGRDVELSLPPGQRVLRIQVGP